jgi:hypothetical protein
MNKYVKIVVILLLISVLFTIINIIIVRNGNSTLGLIEKTHRRPALIYVCSISDNKAIFDKVLFTDGSVPMTYSKGDTVPILTGFEYLDSQKPKPEGIVIIVDKRVFTSGSVGNRLVDEYFIQNGFVRGLGNVPVEKVVEYLQPETGQK